LIHGLPLYNIIFRRRSFRLTITRYKGYWGMLSSQEISFLRAELKRNMHTDSKSIFIMDK
jgi:hypothetical protein